MKQLSWMVLLPLAISCTDKRIPFNEMQAPVMSLPPLLLTEVSDMRYTDQQGNTKDIDAWTMLVKANTLYMTGTPFGFMAADIGSNPESPTKMFSVGENIDHMMPQWVAPWFAGNSISVLGPFAFLSGSVGASVVSLQETAIPQETHRYPPYNANADQPAGDQAFVWNASVADPYQEYVYGFRPQDYILTYQVASDGGLNLVSKQPNGPNGGSICCASSAAVLNGVVVAAFGGTTMFYIANGSGVLNNATEFNLLRATFVAASQNYFYIMHQPELTATAGVASYPAGIYVYNTQGHFVSYLQSEAKVFAVSPDDRYLYANEDDTQIKIYSISQPGQQKPVGSYQSGSSQSPTY